MILKKNYVGRQQSEGRPSGIQNTVMKTISRPEIMLCIRHFRYVSMIAPESVEGITDPDLGAIRTTSRFFYHPKNKRLKYNDTL